MKRIINHSLITPYLFAQETYRVVITVLSVIPWHLIQGEPLFDSGNSGFLCSTSSLEFYFVRASFSFFHKKISKTSSGLGFRV